MKPAIPALILLTMAGASRLEAQARCLPFEPDTVVVAGLLVRRSDPGPPNYESIAAGDLEERYFYLLPVDPLCTLAGADSSLERALQEVRSVQLLLGPVEYDLLLPLLGQVISLRGTLSQAITGHHHAPLLLSVAPPFPRPGSTAIPADVETVVSGGTWSRGEDVGGHYRAIISSAGFEHIISTLRVQWIGDPGESDVAPTVVAESGIDQLDDSGVAIGAVTITVEGSRWVLTVVATQTHCNPMLVEQWRIGLGAPGQLAVLGKKVLEPGCTVDR